MSTFRSLIGAAVCILMLLAAPWAPGAERTADDDFFGKVIRSIRYDAHPPVERAHYDESIGLRPGDTLTRTGLKKAIQALYETGSFSEIAAFAEPEGDGVQLQFQLRASLYFNRFFLLGGVDLGGRNLTEAVSLPAGERFSDEKLDQAQRAVLRYMHEKGYYQAQVGMRTDRDEQRFLVDTTFDVKPGALAKIRSLAVGGVPENEIYIIRQRLKAAIGQDYRRDRFLKRLEGVKQYLVDRGFLDVEPRLTESYQPEDNSIALDLVIANFGRVRVAVEGFKVPKEQLGRMLPVLSGGGSQPGLLEEGAANLRMYLEERGYPESEISIQDSRDAAGSRLLRYLVERGPRITVSQVRFRGNRVFSVAALLKTIQTQPDRFLRRSAYSISKLDSDVEALQSMYRSAGYLGASVVPLVELLGNGESIRITFECREGDQAHARSVKVFPPGSAVPAPSLSARMRLKDGEAYSPTIAERDRQAILALYNDAGFLQPVVTYRAEPADDGRVYDVEFQIQEGMRSFVNRIIVLGSNQTRLSVIEKRIRLKQDEPLSLGKMLETQQALYNTGVFDLVRVAAQNPESNAPYQNVLVRVQEARPVTVRYGLGYQEREKVRGILELSHLNIFGLGRRVDLRLRGSTIAQAGVLSFQQPQFRFLPVDSYFTFSASKKKEVSFDVRRVDLSYQYSRPLNDHTWALLRYRFTNVLVSNVAADLVREETPRNLSTVSATYVNDTRDNYLDPEKGFFTSTDLSIISKLPRRLLNSGHYFSLFTQNSYYRTVTGPLRMVSSMRFGLIHPIAGDKSIPISERFFAGGGSSLRGFETDRAGPLGLNNEPVGGNALLIGNLELRVPLVNRFELAAFYDGGNVFANMTSVRLSEVSHTLGGGLRVRTPFGPVRLDYGVNLNLPARLRLLGYKPGHFFVTIGPSF